MGILEDFSQKKAQRTVGQIYNYDDLTEQEKNDAWLTVNDGVDPRKMMYKFHLLTPDQVEDHFGYPLDESWPTDKQIIKLMEDISQNGVQNAAVDREGNHRLIACALLGIEAPWFEVVENPWAS